MNCPFKTSRSQVKVFFNPVCVLADGSNKLGFKKFLVSFIHQFISLNTGVSESVLLQDFRGLVLDAQLVSALLGSLQLGVQPGFDLQRDALIPPVQQSCSLGLETLQEFLQSLGVLGLSHRHT